MTEKVKLCIVGQSDYAAVHYFGQDVEEGRVRTLCGRQNRYYGCSDVYYDLPSEVNCRACLKLKGEELPKVWRLSDFKAFDRISWVSYDVDRGKVRRYGAVVRLVKGQGGRFGWPSCLYVKVDKDSRKGKWLYGSSSAFQSIDLDQEGLRNEEVEE